MNLPIKIKRTLPSISLYSPIATQKVYLPNQSQPQEISYKPAPMNSQQKNRKQNFNQQQQFPNKKRISPQRIPIFQNAKVLGNNNFPRKINNSLEKVKKSVTFGKNEENNNQNEARFNNTSVIEQNTNRTNTPHRNYSPGRIYKRKSIFEKSEKRVSIAKQTQKIIPVVLNIKQFSDRLKKAQSQKNYKNTHDSKNESKVLKTDIQPNKNPYIQENEVNQSQLLKKIYHIQHIIQDIQQKIVYQSNSKQEVERPQHQKKHRVLQKSIHEQKYKQKQFERAPQSRISGNSTSLNASQSEIENNLLKLQLEQMRRCERIAKQNEILYGKLVKEIEKSENQMRTSRRSSMISYPTQINPKSGMYKEQQNYNLDLRRINKNDGNESHQKKTLQITGPHITAFEDFVQARQLSNHKGNDQNMEITSPFDIAENRKKSETF